MSGGRKKMTMLYEKRSEVGRDLGWQLRTRVTPVGGDRVEQVTRLVYALASTRMLDLSCVCNEDEKRRQRGIEAGIRYAFSIVNSLL